MKFSIIMPVYNREACVMQAIESVRNQQYTDWQLLIVDDGSTDKTLDVCQQYSQDDYRISCFHQENSGVSAARNKGLANAIGDYILFLDSDDMFDKFAMERLNACCILQE